MRFLSGIYLVVGTAVAVLTLGKVAPVFAEGECVGDCDASGGVGIVDLGSLINAALGIEQAAPCGVVGTPTIEHLVLAVAYAHTSCPAVGTPTITATPTLSPTQTPTYDPNAPLGTRRFVSNPSNGGFFVALSGFKVRLGGFSGQSNGVSENAFFDLEAGVPNPVTHIATINVTKASEYLVAPVNMLGANFTVCIKLITPITAAGVIDCDGGSDYSIGLRANHHLGEIGIDGFTAEQCTAMDGIIEEGTRLCKTGKEFDSCRADADCDSTTGSGDGRCGLAPSTCIGSSRAACLNDSECDSSVGAQDGQCGPMLPHPGVCNSTFSPIIGSGDSGPGSVTFAPIAGLAGLPAELNIEQSLPCGDEGPGQALSFALTSTNAEAIIENVYNQIGATLDFKLQQATTATPKQYELQNFSCEQWKDSAGPGCLGLVAPVLHQMGTDVVTAFKLCGR